MPVTRCKNGKYRIGSGPCKYGSAEAAQRAHEGYLAQTGEQRQNARRGGKNTGGF